MDRKEKVTLGGGCFWCLEAVFREVEGVDEVVSGYAGGHTPDPTYQEVCDGATGHAEVVQISYDPGAVSFRDLLEIFFVIHDPTSPDRQGNDIGPQYRSIILPHNQAQKDQSETIIRELEDGGEFSGPIVTEVKLLETFYPAEYHHQNYYRYNSYQPYCRAVIEPKLEKFRSTFRQKLRAEEG